MSRDHNLTPQAELAAELTRLKAVLERDGLQDPADLASQLQQLAFAAELLTTSAA